MERTTLVDMEVLKLLDQFLVLEIDADVYTQAVQYMRVYDMPTYVVLGPSGRERYRQVGPISADKLLEGLTRSLHSETDPPRSTHAE